MTPRLLYISNTASFRDRFRELLPGAEFVSGPEEALRIGGRPAGDSVVLFYEKTSAEADRTDIARLKEHFPLHYLVLVGGALNAGERAAYQAWGVRYALTPGIREKDLRVVLSVINASFSREVPSRKASSPQGGAPLPLQAYRIPLWKRTFDIVCSACALIALSPLLLGVALAIRLESRGPVIYRSKRVGSNYQVFDFLKFRSMYTDAEMALKKLSALNQYDLSGAQGKTAPATRTAHAMAQAGGVMLVSDDCIVSETEHLAQTSTQNEQAFVKLENDPRITPVGRFIRKYSIDELPQLINILRGDMSVVGNRPLPLYEAEKLTSDEYAERFMCPAGLTGLWQVEKRGEAGKLSAEERKRLDIRYARTYSPGMDLRIILKTFLAFVQKENV